MLLKTGTKSGGHPLPTVDVFRVRGWQNGDEKGRVPIIEMGGSAVVPVPTTRHEGGGLKYGQGTLGPGTPVAPEFAPFVYGRWNTKPAGSWPGIMVVYPKSDTKGPQPEKVPSMAIRSRHVWGFPAFISCERSSRCPCVPT